MSLDFSYKNRILTLALPLVKTYGWTSELLEQVTKQHTLPLGEIDLLFPEKEISLLIFFLERSSFYLSQESKPQDFETRGVRARILWALMHHLDYETEFRQEVKQALAELLLYRPWYLAKNAYNAADSIWRFAGDTAVDFNFYSKRLILAGIYTSVRLAWLEDTSDHHAQTEVFARQQLDSTTLVAKLKSYGKPLSACLKSSLHFLAKCRYDW